MPDTGVLHVFHKYIGRQYKDVADEMDAVAEKNGIYILPMQPSMDGVSMNIMASTHRVEVWLDENSVITKFVME